MKHIDFAKGLFLSACLFSLLPAAHAEAGGESSGGGGGGICLPGETPSKPGACRTLAETGFRLSNPTLPDFEIDDDTLAALEDIRSQLPSWLQGHFTRAKVIGDKNTVVTLEIDNADKVKVFTEEYKAIIRKQTPNYDFTNFQLLGFTLEKRTYLIADKFRRMTDPKSRALLLMHEKNIRVNETKVIDAVRFDGMILDYMEAKRGNRLDKFDFWSFYRILGDSNLIADDIARSLMVGDLVQKGMPIDELMKRSTLGGGWYGNFTPVYNQVLDLRKYHARIAQDLGDNATRFLSVKSRPDLVKIAYKALAVDTDKTYSFSATADELNAAIQRYAATLKDGDRAAFDLMGKNCGAGTNKSNFYYLTPWDTETSGVSMLHCELDLDRLNDYYQQVPDLVQSTLFAGLNGTTFTFPGRLSCQRLQRDRNSSSNRPSYQCRLK